MELIDVFLQAGFSLANPNPDHHLPSQKQRMKAGGLKGPVQCHCRTGRGAVAGQFQKGSCAGAQSPGPRPLDLGPLTQFPSGLVSSCVAYNQDR